jgi:hypothetical protein
LQRLGTVRTGSFGDDTTDNDGNAFQFATCSNK